MSPREEHHPYEAEKFVSCILAKTAEIIQKKYNLKSCGQGATMPGGHIQEVRLCFDTKYPFTKEELRKILIESASTLLKGINENKEIQKFIKVKPFSVKNVEITIYNHDQKGRGLHDPQISIARISQGDLIYRTMDPHDSFKSKSQFEESYEEALRAYPIHPRVSKKSPGIE
ncbi:hypothetical protein [Parachlamydia sp. AcF125]|uniref:hypothetical protein n=1 Tax=Parachlamydia sp. AcF125 TaxID=2795736 RepID=UPI001BC9301C|nr:hypothetical protein [Parachlamydia sp. AcF125]